MQKVSSDQEKNRHMFWKEMVLCNAYPQRHQRVWWYNRYEQSGNGSDWSPLWLFQSKRLDLLTSEHAVGWGLSTGLGNQSCVAPWDVACTLETCNSHNWHVPAGGAESLSSVRFAYNYLLKIVNSFPSIWERESSREWSSVANSNPRGSHHVLPRNSNSGDLGVPLIFFYHNEQTVLGAH